ncbi:hypothetical protein [Pseudobdellovibrio exovorus]|uniref:Uncharacterized protein n=1 Tax=Pseudobdellovibrio exovorus JSS TaxID=1184267 RepID=M4V9V3_9BACT|nr:hypothetical protein [Pseudobdellovibrio exovorus]AGH94811.1 hypothetical protein A11Q_591 [Pseudobdellovibrio exovorus JSS]
MKQLNTQKWILSTLLIAALGSQHYLSTSSVNVKPASSSITSGVFEMSSRTPADESSPSADAPSATTPPPAAAAPEVSGEQAPPPASDSTEASVVVCPAGYTCTRTQDTEVAQRDADAIRAETEAERIRRETSERRAAREARREAEEEARIAREEAADALREEKEDRFIEEVERLAESRSNSTLLSRFVSLLSRYKGISPAVANEAYRIHVESRMRDNSGDTSALRDLERLAGRVPSEFSQVKTSMNNLIQESYRNNIQTGLTESLANGADANSIQRLLSGVPSQYNRMTTDIAKQFATTEVQTINTQFQLADQLARQNKLQESLEVRQRAFESQSRLSETLRVYTTAAYNNGDSAFQAYVQRTFMPEIQALLSGIGTTTAGSTTADPSATSRNGMGRGGEQPASTLASPGNIGQSIGTPTIDSSNNLNNAIFGAPTTTPTGTRGGRGI